MTNELNERKIIQALSGIRLPGSEKAITEAGNVSGIVIKEGQVSFTVEIDPKDKDKADELRRACEQTVLGLDAVLSATAVLTAQVMELHFQPCPAAVTTTATDTIDAPITGNTTASPLPVSHLWPRSLVGPKGAGGL